MRNRWERHQRRRQVGDMAQRRHRRRQRVKRIDVRLRPKRLSWSERTRRFVRSVLDSKWGGQSTRIEEFVSSVCRFQGGKHV
jgi:hypothetical protein